MLLTSQASKETDRLLYYKKSIVCGMAHDLESLNILISGGAGFIGSWLSETLLDVGARVVSIDNMSTGAWDNIRHLKINPNFVQYVYDVNDPAIIDDFKLAGFDIVMHFASLASPVDFPKYPIHILDTNLIGTRNMLEIARHSDARFLFASSSEVYGDPDIVPVSETYRGNTNIIGVRGCYDEGKRAGEAYSMAYKREYGLDVRIARIFNTYGERMPKDGRAIPTFIERALTGKYLPIFGDGTQTRAFLYIEDLIEGLITQAVADDISGVPINLGAESETTVLNLAEKITDISKSKSDIKFFPLPEDDPKRRLPDISRARELLDWLPDIQLDEGLRQTIEWWKDGA